MQRSGLSVLCKALFAIGLSFLLVLACVGEAHAATKKITVTLYADSATQATKALKAKGLKPAKAKWKTSKKSVVTVTKKGKAKARKAGKAVVTAKQGKKTWQFVVTVKKVLISKKALTLKVNGTATLKLTGDGVKSVISDNHTIASVTKSGKVTARTAGTATITIKSKKGKAYTCKVTVRPINVTPGRKVVRIPVASAVQTLRFVAPEDGTYVLESLGSSDTIAYLLDERGKAIASDDDGGEGNNFLIRHKLVGGRTYQYRVRYYSSGVTGSMVLLLSREVSEGSFGAKIAWADTCQRLRFVPDYDGLYVFESSDTSDTRAYLYDSTGSEITSDDDGGNDGNFRITYQLTAGCVYYYDVRYWSSDLTGTIPLSLARIDDLATMDIELGSASVAISEEGGSRRLRFTPNEDGTYVLHSSGFDDTKACLYDEAGNKLVSDDDGGEGSNFLISYELEAGRTYYYDVSYWSSGTTGTMELLLVKMSGDAVVEIEPGSFTATIELAGIRRRLAFACTEGGTYVLESAGDTDTVAYLYDETGTELASNDDGGKDGNFRLSYVLKAGQTYYYEVGYFDSGVAGTLNLSLSKVEEPTPTDVNLGVTGVEIEAAGMCRRLRFTPSEDGTYAFDSIDNDDVATCLLDTTGNELESDTDGGGSSITRSLKAGRSYYYDVYYLDTSKTGTIKVLLSEVDVDAALDIVPGSFTVDIDTAGARKRLAFACAEDGIYVLESAAYADTIAYLYDEAGNKLASDDDSGGSSNFSLSYALEAGRTYYYDVRFYMPDVTGTMEVTLSGETGQESTATQIELGSFTVDIDTGGARKRLSFVCPEDGTYVLESTGDADTVAHLYDGAGNELASDDDGGNGSNFRLSYALEAGSTYFYDVRFYGSDMTGAMGVALSKEMDQEPSLIEIEPGSFTVSIDSAGARRRLSFACAEDGTYVLESTGDADTVAHLYDGAGNELASDDDGGDGRNFRLSHALEAGNTYFYDVRYYGSAATGTIKVTFARQNDPTPPPTPTTDTTYRALLISEVDFSSACWRNEGDVQLMKSMLESVTGPDGGIYSIKTGMDSTPEQIQSLIGSTFSGADEDDVSLFFIATHGDTESTGSYAGALATSSGKCVLFHELASWLSAVPGKVIVVVESCGSGAAVYSTGETQNGLKPQALGVEEDETLDEQFTQSLIDAFAAYDETVRPAADGPVANTGELRVANKFYVLTASRYQEYSWGTESGPYNYFTKWLTEGVGTSGTLPADQSYGNQDGVVSLEELFSYISAVGDNHDFYDGYSIYYQHVQRYPQGSDYGLFRRH